MPKTWLIVGASRGIGLELSNQLIARGENVLCTARDPSALRARFVAPPTDGSVPLLFPLDVTHDAQISETVAAVTKAAPRIDYAVLVAGVLKHPCRAVDVSITDMDWHMRTNAFGPVRVAQALLHCGAHVGTLAFMSSDSGSMGNWLEHEDGFAAYGASKAALNMFLRHMAAELKRKGDGVTVLAVHPGEVATDMAADVDLDWEVPDQLTAKESAEAVIKVIEGKTVEQTGTFWTWKDEQYPW